MIFITLIIPSNLEAWLWHQVINNYLHALTSTLTLEKEKRNNEGEK